MRKSPGAGLFGIMAEKLRRDGLTVQNGRIPSGAAVYIIRDSLGNVLCEKHGWLCWKRWDTIDSRNRAVWAGSPAEAFTVGCYLVHELGRGFFRKRAGSLGVWKFGMQGPISIWSSSALSRIPLCTDEELDKSPRAAV